MSNENREYGGMIILKKNSRIIFGSKDILLNRVLPATEVLPEQIPPPVPSPDELREWKRTNGIKYMGEQVE